MEKWVQLDKTRKTVKASRELCEVSTELDIRIPEEDSVLTEDVDS